ncbi:MAG: non-ribosomal peptide synthetase, partial [Phaeodactylibacter sp.]|nr:non-ribosomal peptide synthetase [Phaeodactylibacter sp.]
VNDADQGQLHVSNGKPVNGARIVIVDNETHTICPNGVEGEIWASYSRSISTGYWQRPDASDETFKNFTASGDGPFLRTGDLGFQLEGELFITGRTKDMIIIRGTNYYPDDIEEVVGLAHPALQENGCAAFAVEEGQEERLVIVQEVNRTEWRNADEEQVVNAIRQEVSEVFEIQPYAILLIRPMSLPKTSSGKIQRYATKMDYVKEKLRLLHQWKAPLDMDLEAVTIAVPGSDGFGTSSISLWLRQQIAEKVKMPVEQIEPHLPVKAFPLDSVDAVFISDELSNWLKLRLTPDTFWAFDSIRELSVHLLEKYQNAHNG